MLQHQTRRVLIVILRVLAVVFLAIFLLGLLPLFLSMVGFDDLGPSESVFGFFWVSVAYWFYRMGAPETLVSTGSHIPFFSPLGYCLIYLVPAVLLGAASWALNRQSPGKRDVDG